MQLYLVNWNGLLDLTIAEDVWSTMHVLHHSQCSGTYYDGVQCRAWWSQLGLCIAIDKKSHFITLFTPYRE